MTHAWPAKVTIRRADVADADQVGMLAERVYRHGGWGDEGYAREELVAELGAAFLCADLDLTPEVRDDHASYIATLADGSQEREAGDFQRRRARTTCRRFPSRA